jgi:glutamate synthase (NADPH/NADH) small chain
LRTPRKRASSSLLTNPFRVIGEDKGWVTGLEWVKMELGEPDKSGRRRPVPIPGSEYVIECDIVVMALGTSPNPIISSTTPGLQTKDWGGLVATETGRTTRKGVWAGGDAVTGSATVILAMGAARPRPRTLTSTSGATAKSGPRQASGVRDPGSVEVPG